MSSEIAHDDGIGLSSETTPDISTPCPSALPSDGVPGALRDNTPIRADIGSVSPISDIHESKTTSDSSASEADESIEKSVSGSKDSSPAHARVEVEEVLQSVDSENNNSEPSASPLKVPQVDEATTDNNLTNNNETIEIGNDVNESVVNEVPESDSNATDVNMNNKDTHQESTPDAAIDKVTQEKSEMSSEESTQCEALSPSKEAVDVDDHKEKTSENLNDKITEPESTDEPEIVGESSRVCTPLDQCETPPSLEGCESPEKEGDRSVEAVDNGVTLKTDCDDVKSEPSSCTLDGT